MTDINKEAVQFFDDGATVDLEKRIDILERRLKRIAAERNKARHEFARLAKVVQPFANQTARSFRHWLDTTPPDVVFKLSGAVESAVNKQDSQHTIVARILIVAEDLAVGVENRRIGQGEDQDDVELNADRLLNYFDKLHKWD